MNKRNETESSDQNVTHLTKRARLDNLLFKGAKRPGPSFMPIKWPEALGE